MPADDTVRVRVPAKVNLHLGVGAFRPDGFHELVTVFHAVDLADEIRVRPGAGLAVRISGEGAARLPTGAANLAWQAATLLADHTGASPHAVIEIEKRIPVAGGMAGGSADAAGTLLACATLWRTGSSAEELQMLAARLGSDVPFALLGGTALGTGRGEVLTPAPTSATLHWVLAVADYGIATADAYRELDRLRASRPTATSAAGDVATLLEALRRGDLEQVSHALHNDLQEAALQLAPALGDTLTVGQQAGSLAGIVSGSGPTVAFLCADDAMARQVATALRTAGVCRTAHIASGPAPGAQLVR